MIYWVVVLGGGAVAITGYLLMFPFYGTDIAGMQLAQIVHGIVGVLFVAAMLAHIYIGTHRHGGRVRGDGQPARSTSTGPRSTTASGSSRRRPAPARTSRSASRWRSRPSNDQRLTGVGPRPAHRAGRFLMAERCALFAR